MERSITVYSIEDSVSALRAVLEEADHLAIMMEDLICIRVETPDRKIAEIRLETFKRKHDA